MSTRSALRLSQALGLETPPIAMTFVPKRLPVSARLRAPAHRRAAFGARPSRASSTQAPNSISTAPSGPW